MQGIRWFAAVAVSLLAGSCSDEAYNKEQAKARWDKGGKAEQSFDYVTARKEYAAACKGGHALGCGRLGVLQLQGQGGEEDKAAARQSLAKGCELGSFEGLPSGGIEVETMGTACFVGGALTWNKGDGKKEEFPRARALLEKACRSGAERFVGLACTSLAAMWGGGHGGDKDFAKALEFFELGCQAGEQVACEGISMTKDQLRAAGAGSAGSGAGSAGGGAGSAGGAGGDPGHDDLLD